MSLLNRTRYCCISKACCAGRVIAASVKLEASDTCFAALAKAAAWGA